VNVNPAAAAAIRILVELDRESELDRRARDVASIDLEFALVYFAEPRGVVGRVWPSLPPVSRDTLLDFLLRNESQDTTRALVKTWDIVVRDLIALAISDLDRDSTVIAERGLRVAAAIGTGRPIDQYLEYILVSWGVTGLSDTAGANWPARIRPRVDLLLALQVPGPEEFAMTRTRLRVGVDNGWQAQLVRALITEELATGEIGRARGWAEWLFGSVGPGDEKSQNWLTALDFIVAQRPTQGAAASAINEMTHADPAWAIFLAWTARAFERLPDSLELLGPGLVRFALRVADQDARRTTDEDARKAAADRDALREVLEIAFVKLGALAGDLAWVDGARLIISLESRYMPHPLNQVDLFKQYAAGLDGVLHFLANFQVHRDLIQDVFQRYALHVDPNADEPFPLATVELIKKWAPRPDREPLLARYIQAIGAENILLAHNQLAPEDWKNLAVYVPEFRGLESTGLLWSAIKQIIEGKTGKLTRETFDFNDESGVRHIGVSSSALAAALFDACENNMSPRQILNVISSVRLHDAAPHQPSDFITAVSEDELQEALREMQSLLRNRPIDREDPTGHLKKRQYEAAEQTWIEFLALITSEPILGAGYGKRFWKAVNSRARHGEKVHRRLRRWLWWRRLRGRFSVWKRKRAVGVQSNAGPPAAQGSRRRMLGRHAKDVNRDGKRGAGENPVGGDAGAPR
jgi:hypothetical protein